MEGGSGSKKVTVRLDVQRGKVGMQAKSAKKKGTKRGSLTGKEV